MGQHKAITFDDVSLVPGYSDTERDEIDISSYLFDDKLAIPIISSPMDTITGIDMVCKMRVAGGMGIHHRYCNLDRLEEASLYGAIAISPSIGIPFIEKLLGLRQEVTAVLDVAHGHTKRNLEFCAELVKIEANVVSGNIVTPYAAEAYLKIGVKVLRVGIGAGSVCTTRMVTGVGVPQLTAIRDIYNACPEATIISDGGHRTTGDIVKALAFGANFVMLGGMLAGTDEAEGGTHFRGMASAGALSQRKKEYFVEGIGKDVEPKGSVVKVLNEIKQAIETACYYLGVRNLSELSEVDYIEVTHNGYLEGLAR